MPETHNAPLWAWLIFVNLLSFGCLDLVCFAKLKNLLLCLLWMATSRGAVFGIVYPISFGLNLHHGRPAQCAVVFQWNGRTKVGLGLMKSLVHHAIRLGNHCHWRQSRLMDTSTEACNSPAHRGCQLGKRKCKQLNWYACNLYKWFTASSSVPGGPSRDTLWHVTYDAVCWKGIVALERVTFSPWFGTLICCQHALLNLVLSFLWPLLCSSIYPYV